MITRPAARKATIGDTSAGRMTLPTSPENLTPEAPTAASMAPITPPMSACEELDGNP